MVKDVRQGFPERCVQVSKVMFCRNGTTGSIGNSRQNMDVVNELQVTKAIHGKVWLWGKVCTCREGNACITKNGFVARGRRVTEIIHGNV